MQLHDMADKIKEKIDKENTVRSLKPERFLFLFFLVTACILFFWSLIAVFLDPYMVWHRAIGLSQVYSNPYAMIPGIIRQCSYDTLVVGSSLSQNFYIDDINRCLGGKAVKATAPGACGPDHLRFMEEAAAAGKVKRLIICADLWSYIREDKKEHWNSYRYLYGTRNWLIYLFSYDTVKAVGDVIKNNFSGKMKRKYVWERSYDRMFSNYFWEYIYSRESMEKSIQTKEQRPPRAKTLPEPYLDEWIFSFARKHPEMRFDLFLAPVSIYFWCGVSELGDMESYLNTRLKMAEMCSRTPNVFLHDTQSAEEIICHLDYYKDISHYSSEINHWILLQIKANPDGQTVNDIIDANIKLRKMTAKHLSDYQKLFVPIKKD